MVTVVTLPYRGESSKRRENMARSKSKRKQRMTIKDIVEIVKALGALLSGVAAIVTAISALLK